MDEPLIHKIWRPFSALSFAAVATVMAFSLAGTAWAAGLGQAATQTSLSVSTAGGSNGSIVTLTADVTALNESDGTPPAGVVTFRSGGHDLGSAIVNSQGEAVLKTGNLPPGSHQVVAVYQGDAQNGVSISPSSQLDTPSSQVAGFNVTATPSSLKTVAGGFASSVVTVTPVSGFNAYVSLSCSGAPINATCTFSPTNVKASCVQGAGGSEVCTPVNSTLQIQTLSPGGGRVNNGISSLRQGKSGLPAYAFAFPALFGIIGLGARRKRVISSLALMLFLLAVSLSLSSCKEQYNYLNHGPPANTGTPTGNYTVTIDAISTSGSFITRPATAPQITLTVSSAN